MTREMNTKRIALVAVFAALAIVLNPDVSRISIPSPFFGLPYQVWEIPIFVAFLVVGPVPGLFIALIGSLALLVLHPNIVGFGGIVACLAMLGGFHLACKLVTRNTTPEKPPSTKRVVIATTAGGVIFRTGIMAVQNYYMLPLMGLDFPQSVLVTVVSPVVALFNATEPLYVIPISYFLGKAINSQLKLDTES